MDDTTIGEHLVEVFLTLSWSPCFSFHFDKKHLVVADAEAKEVKEAIWQALDDVLPVHAEKFPGVSPKDLASGFGQGHHGEFLNI